MKVREGGRIVNIACLLAVGVNSEGHREILGIDLATAEDGAGWLAFFRREIPRRHGIGEVRLLDWPGGHGAPFDRGAVIDVPEAIAPAAKG